MLFLIELGLADLICYKELNQAMKQSLEMAIARDCGVEFYQQAKADIELINNVLEQIEKLIKDYESNSNVSDGIGG